MRLQKLGLKDYRNLCENTIEFCEGINVLFGENAQGKTNILEAIWHLTGARSFRGTKDKDLVFFGKNTASIQGEAEFRDFEKKIKIHINGGKRRCEVNGVNRGPAYTIIGLFRAVIFSPEHLLLVKGAPENRRKFIDAAICQIKPMYALTLSKFNKTLKHRNSLLKNTVNMPEWESVLEAWDRKLAEYAAGVIFERIKYTAQLKEKAKYYYKEVSGGEALEIEYKTFADFTGVKQNEIMEVIIKRLKETRKIDFIKGTTEVGPHRDEINIKIKEKSAKLFGSQGQQRSAAIALKLAEAAIAANFTGEAPVILLDDILSELDEKRQKQILNLTDGAQIFITGCERPKWNRNLKCFCVKNGKVFEE